MSVIACGWALGGLGIGCAHALLIRCSAHRPAVATALWSEARLLLVAGGLGVAAYAGGVVPAALGWAAGFVVSCLASWRLLT